MTTRPFPLHGGASCGAAPTLSWVPQGTGPPCPVLAVGSCPDLWC